MDHPTAQERAEAARGERLDSWKEIAAYLKRDVRTVQRWEKQEGLPVHRHLHDERATAYAFSSEIDEWLNNRRRQDNEADASYEAVVSRPAPPATPFSQRKSRLVLAAVALVVSAASGIAIWAVARSRPDRTQLSSLSVVFGPSERFREWGPEMALSPDGSTLVYSSADMGAGLRVRRIDRLESHALEGARGDLPFFSPDGRWIGFIGSGRLLKISAEGGTPVPVGAAPGFIGSADWGSDDFIIYAAITPEGTHGLYRLAASGGTPQLIAALDGKAEDAYWLTPQSLSDGKVILCTLARATSSGSRFQVVAVSVATGERRVLVDDARHGLYLGDGVLVYLRNSALFATRFDVNRLDVAGPHVPAWDNVFERVRLRSFVSAAGTLVYWPTLRVGRRLVWVDRTGKQESLPLPPALYLSPRLSPDGQSVAFGISDSSEFGDVWKHDFSTGAAVQLTTDGRSGTPMWTPDGTGIVFSSLRSAGRDLFLLRLGVAPEPQPIHLPAGFLAGASKEPASWADDGRTLLVRQSSINTQPLIWAVALDGSREPRPVLPRDMTRDNHFRVSPDGRWIAYEGGDKQTDVYVAPYQGGRPSWKVSTDGGALPVWSRSGRELFYRRGEAMMAVPVTPGTTFTSGAPRLLFKGRFFEADPGTPNYDVAPDDRRFLMVLPGDTEGPDRLNVVQGWKHEITRRLRESS